MGRNPAGSTPAQCTAPASTRGADDRDRPRTLRAAAGIRREERVLRLMHDNPDGPVAFLGAMYAGIVPVAVHTLATADDCACMLGHGRVQAALASAALLPVLGAALAHGGHEVGLTVVSPPDDALPSGAAAIEAAVIGVADDQGLTRAKAFVVRKTGAQAGKCGVRASVKERLAPHKQPRMIECVSDLRKTATGKIQRFRLREREAAAH